MRKTKVEAMSADSDSSQVEDAQAPLSVADFSKRQVAVIERQVLSATDLADLIDLSMTGIRPLSGGSQVEVWLHDPVDELDRHLDVIGVLSGMSGCWRTATILLRSIAKSLNGIGRHPPFFMKGRSSSRTRA